MICKFARVKTELMETLIPEGVPFSTTPTGEVDAEDAPILRQRTLREFTHPQVTLDLDDGTSVFMLNCNQEPDRGGRTGWGPEQMDIDEWLTFLEPHGITEADLLSLEEYNALLPVVEI